MIEYNNLKKIKHSSLFEIINKYEVLLYDDEPILFTGRNNLNNIILGSSVDEDYSSKIEQFFYTIISEDIFLKFINKELSYLDILKTNNIFLIVKSFDGVLFDVYPLNIEDIPKNYLPLEDSFYPNNSDLDDWKEGINGCSNDVSSKIKEIFSEG